MAKKQHTVLNYQVAFQEESSGGYSVWVPDLPGCASQGETLDEAKHNIEEAIQLYLEDAPVKEIQETVSPFRRFFIPISVSFPAIHG